MGSSHRHRPGYIGKPATHPGRHGSDDQGIWRPKGWDTPTEIISYPLPLKIGDLACPVCKQGSISSGGRVGVLFLSLSLSFSFSISRSRVSLETSSRFSLFATRSRFVRLEAGLVNGKTVHDCLRGQDRSLSNQRNYERAMRPMMGDDRPVG